MFPLRARLLGTVAAVTLCLSIAACQDDTTEQAAVEPADVEAFLQANIGGAGAFFDAVRRVVLAAAGDAVEGVTFTPVADGLAVTIGMDFDGDGTYETTASGLATFWSPDMTFEQGATVEINSISTPGGMSGSGSADVAATANGGVAYAPGSASFRTGSGAEVDIPAMGFTVTPFADFIVGFVDFEVREGGGTVAGTIFFEDDGSGGWQMRVEGEDFEFVVD